MSKRRFVKCEICGNRSIKIVGEKRSFMAKFPLDESRCKEWVKAVGKEDLVYVPIEKLHQLKHVCGRHFKDKAFNKKKSRLKKSAVPTENLTGHKLPDELFLQFPCRIYSNIVVNDNEDSQGNHEDENRLSQADTPDPSNTKSCMTEEIIFQIPNNDSPNGNPNKTKQNQSCKTKSCMTEMIMVQNPNQDSPLLNKTEQNQSCKTKSSPPWPWEHNYCKIKEDMPESPKKKILQESDVLNKTPRKKKRTTKLKTFKQKVKVVREGYIVPRIKSMSLKTLINAYMRNHTRKPYGKRWTPFEKAIAIAIYKKSPRIYWHLKHLMALVLQTES